MDINDLFRMGAELIQNNDDDATTGLDLDSISGALSSLFGNSEGGFDLSSIIGALSQGGLSEVVQSWIGSGENISIDISQVTEILGGDKISAFASQLGIGEESAAKALADALPNLVDQATPDGESMLGNLLDSVGGVSGAMGMPGKMFG